LGTGLGDQEARLRKLALEQRLIELDECREAAENTLVKVCTATAFGTACSATPSPTATTTETASTSIANDTARPTTGAVAGSALNSRRVGPLALAPSRFVFEFVQLGMGNGHRTGQPPQVYLQQLPETKTL
jgi:hypothetical protein